MHAVVECVCTNLLVTCLQCALFFIAVIWLADVCRTYYCDITADRELIVQVHTMLSPAVLVSMCLPAFTTAKDPSPIVSPISVLANSSSERSQ